MIMVSNLIDISNYTVERGSFSGVITSNWIEKTAQYSIVKAVIDSVIDRWKKLRIGRKTEDRKEV